MHVYLPPTAGLLNILVAKPLSSEFSTHNTVKARFWPWLELFLRRKSIKTLNLLSLLDRMQGTVMQSIFGDQRALAPRESLAPRALQGLPLAPLTTWHTHGREVWGGARAGVRYRKKREHLTEEVKDLYLKRQG